jgi:DNA adenine methylase
MPELPAPFQYYGGKTYLRDFILPHLQGGKIYVEPYCGSANIFFAKDPHPVEVLNDLNGEIVNFFRVLQDPDHFKKFVHRVRWTPYSLDELREAIRIRKAKLSDPVLRAWAMFVIGSQAINGKAESEGNWSRTFIPTVGRRSSIRNDGMAQVTSRWKRKISYLEAWRDRIFMAQIDSRDALQVIEYWDSPETLFYLDPPYAEATRISPDVYSHEMKDAHHSQLVETLLKVKGRVVLSGYDSPLYAPLVENGWMRLGKEVSCSTSARARGQKQRGDGGLQTSKRIESLWLNRLADQPDLFFAEQRSEAHV